MLMAGEFNASTPLFEGGDCEDCVQRICEIVNTIKANLDSMIRTVRDHLGLDFDPPAVRGVFGADTDITSCFYMARGIYHDPNPDEGSEAEPPQQHESTGNHTFGVVAHTVAACFHFSVVECVSAVLILHDKKGSECEHMADAFQHRMKSLQTNLDVINEDEAAEAYRHVLWMGTYMVFEYTKCRRNNADEMLLSYGAATYQTYAQCVQIDDSFTDVHAIIATLTPMMTNSPEHDSEFVLVLPLSIFYDVNMYRFLRSKTQQAQYQLCPRAQDVVGAKMLQEQVTEEAFMDSFVRCYIDTVYSDNLVVSAQRTRHFFDRHPRLLDFRHNSGLLLSLCMSAKPSVLSCNTDTTRNNSRTSNNIRTPPTGSLAAPPSMLPALAVQPIRVLHTASTSVQVCVVLAVIDMQLKPAHSACVINRCCISKKNTGGVGLHGCAGYACVLQFPQICPHPLVARGQYDGGQRRYRSAVGRNRANRSAYAAWQVPQRVRARRCHHQYDPANVVS